MDAIPLVLVLLPVLAWIFTGPLSAIVVVYMEILLVAGAAATGRAEHPWDFEDELQFVPMDKQPDKDREAGALDCRNCGRRTARIVEVDRDEAGKTSHI